MCRVERQGRCPICSGAPFRANTTADSFRDLVRRYEAKVESDRSTRDQLKGDVYQALKEAERNTNAVRDRLDEIRRSLDSKI